MTFDPAFREMPLDRLAVRCAEETAEFFAGRSPACPAGFELFRRALSEADQGAWEALYAQYRGQTTGWVVRHPGFPNSGEEAEYFVNQAFERMWAAVTPAKFERFADIRAVLAYLKMCVHGAIVDAARRAGPPPRAIPDELQEQQAAEGAAFETGVLVQESARDLWQMVQARLLNEKETLVVHCLFVLDLKPRTIQARYPDKFAGTQEIYRIRQNVLDRLSRDPELRMLANEYA